MRYHNNALFSPVIHEILAPDKSSVGLLQLTRWPIEDIACISGGKALTSRRPFDMKYASFFGSISDELIKYLENPLLKKYILGLKTAAFNKTVPVQDIRDAALGIGKIIRGVVRNPQEKPDHQANLLIGAIYLAAGASRGRFDDNIFKSALGNLEGINANMKGEKVTSKDVSQLIDIMRTDSKYYTLARNLANYNTVDKPAQKEEGAIGHKYYYAISILLKHIKSTQN